MSEHTPGPWGVAIGVNRFIVRPTPGPTPEAEQEANMILVAAAPDLLNFVRTVADDEHDDACDIHKDDGCTCYVEEAKRLVAKATIIKWADHDPQEPQRPRR